MNITETIANAREHAPALPETWEQIILSLCDHIAALREQVNLAKLAVPDAVAKMAKLVQERDALRAENEQLIDNIDLNRDEFLRIKSCPVADDEIKGLCERSQARITQRVPVIQQRDKAERERDALRAELDEARILRRTDRETLEKELAALLSERRTVHEWLNTAGFPKEENGARLCLLRRLRIAVDRYLESQEYIQNDAVPEIASLRDRLRIEKEIAAKIVNERDALRAAMGAVQETYAKVIAERDALRAENLMLKAPYLEP